MPMLGYAEFAGREVVNNSRAAAYSSVSVHCGCTTLPAMLGERYTNPARDPAPWYDRAAPESAEFWGIIGMEIHGASQSTLATPFTDLVGDGAVPGSPRRAAREVEFKVMLLAASEAGLSWGVTWLSAVLRGSQCNTTCIGDTLCLLSGCPDPPPVNHRALCSPEPEPRPQPVHQRWTPQQAGRQLLRQLYDCALLEFASDETRQRIQGAWTSQLTFTIKAGRPGWYTHPVTVIDSREPELNRPAVQDVIHGYRIDQPAPCPQPPDCLEGSPYATGHGPWGPEPFPGSDSHDPVFRDPCYPTDAFDAQRAVYSTASDVTSTWLQKVPIITIHTGGSDMHRVTIRFYANPRNRPPGPTLDPCEACTEITVPWIPARTRLTLDGRTQQVKVRCPNQRTRAADITLYGPLGSVLEWPEFDCGMPMIVEMLCKVGTIAPDAWYRFQWSSKADAI